MMTTGSNNIDKVTMIKQIILLSVFISALLSGCSAYKMEVQQGNYITQQELNLVKRGMSRAEVQQILGTPLLQDDFNQGRWDYVFLLRSGNGKTKRNGVTVFFQNGVVSDLRVDPVKK